ncbi:MAG: hypothetical protein ACREV4_10180 [Gammaproteobacteria bacterium]
MDEDFGDHGEIFDGGNDFQGSAAAGTPFNIDMEYPFTKALTGFHPLGRPSPFKTTPGGFVSSRAQFMRPGTEWWSASQGSAEEAFGLTGALGMVSAHRLALVREHAVGWSLERGTSAARSCMNSSGDMMMCVVPSR